MAEWAIRRLGDMAQLTMGQSPPGSRVVDLEGGLPFLQGNAEFGPRYPTARYQCDEAVRQCAPGDSLISVRAPVGAINRADCRYGIGRGLAAVSFDTVDPTFGHHALVESSSELQRIAQGTTFSAIGRSELAELQVPVPPLGEQHRIAEILDTIDDAIQAVGRVIAKLGDMQEGLVQCYPLEGGLAHETVSRELPDGWRYLTLEETAVNHDGRRVPIRAEDRLERSGSYPYYGASGVIDYIDGYLFDGTFVLLGEDGENVLSRSTPLAFVARGRIWVNNHAHVFEARSGVDSRFLARVLERTDYTAIVSGSAQPKITQFGLRQMRFPMPSQEVQKKLCDELEIVDNRIASEIHHAAGLTAVRTGLAADLLSGRVRTVAA